MKKSADIIGLPLMGIKEGVQIGTIIELILDADAHEVRYLVIDGGEGCLGFKVIDLADIAGIGSDYVTTATLDAATNLWENRQAIELKYSSIHVLRSKVIACQGNFMGSVLEFAIDECSGKIALLLLEASKIGLKEISGDSIIAMAKDQIFVDFDAAAINSKPKADTEETTHTPSAREAIEKTLAAPPKPKENQFEIEQRQYLLGRIVSANVLDDDEILIKKGDKVTHEIIDLAKAKDRLIDLTLNVD